MQYQAILQEKVGDIVQNTQFSQNTISELILIPSMSYKLHKLESD